MLKQLVSNRPRSDRNNSHTMSASRFYGDSVVQRVNEVPPPSKTSPLPIIALSGQLMSQSSVTPNLSDPLICLTDEDPYCVSLPIKRSKQTDQFENCSFSCDNLSLCVSPCGGATGGAGRLTKASSDNPIFASGSPPIPPRDYVPRTHSSRPTTLEQKLRKPEIHPIVQDGQKRSNTHYWLLPDKQKTSSSLDAVDRTEEEPGLYVNYRSNELSAKKCGIFSQFASLKGKPAEKGGKEHGRRQHHASDGGAVKHGGRLDRSPEEVPLLSDVSSIDSMSVGIPADDSEELADLAPSAADERMASMGEIKEMVDKVQSKVDGVTADESYTALALHHWNVETAVEYLKVENLFRLGLASRERCRQMLEAYGWNLERAASRLLDLMSSDSVHRK